MPKLLVDQDVFEPAISVPVNGDKINGTAFEVPYQALANRTRNVRNELNTGIKRVREVADKAALLALVGVKTGDFAYVVGMGLYRFQTEDPSVDWSPGVIASPTQGGRWWNAAISSGTSSGGVLWASEGGAVLKSGLSLNINALALSGPMTKIGPTAVTHERVHVVPTDGDKTISVADGDVIFAYGSMVADRDYTLATPTGATPQIRVVLRPQPGIHLTLKRASDGATIASMINGGGTAPYFWSVLCQHSSDGWERIG